MDLKDAIKFVLANGNLEDGGSDEYPYPSKSMNNAIKVLERFVEIEESDREHLGTCESCSALIFEGDPHHHTADGCFLCSEHSPMISDVINQLREMAGEDPFDPRDETAFDTPQEVMSWIALTEADIATNGDRKAYT